MNLLVVSYKVCWADPSSPGGFVSYAGFPFQMAALSQLFSSTELLLLERKPPLPPGCVPLTGRNLSTRPLPEPTGTDLRRKLALLLWFPRYLLTLWRRISAADAVHALVPGDLGTLGLLIALIQRKPLFVRHCGTWNHRQTQADRFLSWLLPKVAGGRTVVMATGGSEVPPCAANPAVAWIFSTTLSRGELEALPPARAWKPGEDLRLVTVGRLSHGKNTRAAVAALAILRERFPGAHLDVVGEGPRLGDIEAQVADLGLEDAVTLHGNLRHERVLEVLRRAHLFLFPTRVAEGFPKAVIEAMACGLPVIVPPVSVLPKLISRGGGWLLKGTHAEATDGRAVAQAVVAALENPEELARRGAAARDTAREYTLEAWQEWIRSHLERAWGCVLEPSESGS